MYFSIIWKARGTVVFWPNRPSASCLARPRPNPPSRRVPPRPDPRVLYPGFGFDTLDFVCPCFRRRVQNNYFTVPRRSKNVRPCSSPALLLPAQPPRRAPPGRLDPPCLDAHRLVSLVGCPCFGIDKSFSCKSWPGISCREYPGIMVNTFFPDAY